MSTIICPSCDGSGTIHAFLNGGEHISRHRYGPTPCITCGGSGAVDARMPEWRRRGGEWRLSMAKRRLTMWEVAKRLGVLAVDVSAAYSGLVDPEPLIRAWDALLTTQDQGDSLST